MKVIINKNWHIFFILLFLTGSFIFSFDEEPKDIDLGTKRLPDPYIKDIKKGFSLAREKLKLADPTMSHINFLAYDKSLNKFKVLRDLSEVISGQPMMIHIRSNQKLYPYILYIDTNRTLYTLYDGTPIQANEDL